jgi:hypothetical protein
MSVGLEPLAVWEWDKCRLGYNHFVCVCVCVWIKEGRDKVEPTIVCVRNGNGISWATTIGVVCLCVCVCVWIKERRDKVEPTSVCV